MRPGTRILLAVIALFVGILVIYYGFVLPEDDPAGEGAASAERSAERSGEGGGGEREMGTGTEIEMETGTGRETGTGAGAGEPPVLTRPAAVPVEMGASQDRDGGSALRRPEDRVTPPGPGPQRPGSAATGAGTPAGTTGEGDRPRSTPSPETGRDETSGTRRSADPASDRVNPPAPKAETTPPAPVLRESAPPPVRSRAAAPPRYTAYTVKSGDTMSSIAESWFGDANKWDLIAKANLVDPNRLTIGQKLRLPPKDASRDPIPGSAGPRAVTYVVRSGDTLSGIAKAFYDDMARWRDIFAANRSTLRGSPDALEVGMKLTIPPAAGKAREAAK